jgi:CBS domain containing-hemolysin-like protein
MQSLAVYLYVTSVGFVMAGVLASFVQLVSGEQEEDIDTLGGLMFSLLGRVPVRGELVRHPSGLELEVLDADARRLKKVKIHQPRVVDTPLPEDGKA